MSINKLSTDILPENNQLYIYTPKSGNGGVYKIYIKQKKNKHTYLLYMLVKESKQKPKHQSQAKTCTSLDIGLLLSSVVFYFKKVTKKGLLLVGDRVNKMLGATETLRTERGKNMNQNLADERVPTQEQIYEFSRGHYNYQPSEIKFNGDSFLVRRHPFTSFNNKVVYYHASGEQLVMDYDEIFTNAEQAIDGYFKLIEGVGHTITDFDYGTAYFKLYKDCKALEASMKTKTLKLKSVTKYADRKPKGV